LFSDLLRRAFAVANRAPVGVQSAYFRRIAGNYLWQLRNAADVASINACLSALSGGSEPAWRRERLLRFARIEAQIDAFVRWLEQTLCCRDNGTLTYVDAGYFEAVFAGSSQCANGVLAILRKSRLAKPVDLPYRWSAYAQSYAGRVGFFHGTKARGSSGTRVKLRNDSAAPNAADPNVAAISAVCDGLRAIPRQIAERKSGGRNGDYRTLAGVARIIDELRSFEAKYSIGVARAELVPEPFTKSPLWA